MPRERTTSAAIVRWLNEQPLTWATAITAGPYTRRGLPDIFAIVDGQALMIEVKQPGGAVTPMQAATIAKMQIAGAVAVVARSLEDAQLAHEQSRLRGLLSASECDRAHFDEALR